MYELIITNRNYSSWSMRAWVLMRHADIAFAERLVRYGPGGFRQHTPSGRVPCLVDDDMRVWDTLAITEYLAERHAGVWPEDARVRAWARSAAAEMHSGFMALRNECSMSVGVRLRRYGISDALQADLARLAELWSDGLARHGGPFLGGATFTAVDAFFAPVANTCADLCAAAAVRGGNLCGPPAGSRRRKRLDRGRPRRGFPRQPGMSRKFCRRVYCWRTCAQRWSETMHLLRMHPVLACAALLLLAACHPLPLKPEGPQQAVTPPPPPPVLNYEPAEWTSLPGWNVDDIGAAWPALLTSCRAPRMAPAWSGFCGAAQTIAATDVARAARADRDPPEALAYHHPQPGRQKRASRSGHRHRLLRAGGERCPPARRRVPDAAVCSA